MNQARHLQMHQVKVIVQVVFHRAHPTQSRESASNRPSDTPSTVQSDIPKFNT